MNTKIMIWDATQRSLVDKHFGEIRLPVTERHISEKR